MLVRQFMVLACLGTPLVSLNAQPPAKNDNPPANAADQFPPHTGGELKLEDREIPTTAEIQRVTRFARSSDPDTVAGGNDRALLEKVIKYYLYRLTWEEVHEARDPQKSGTITDIMNEIVAAGDVITRYRLLPPTEARGTDDPDVLAQRTRQLRYVQLVTPIFLQHAREVLKSKELVARVNTARVLAKLAELGQEGVVNDLVRIIRHPQEHDAVRYWAFVGLEEIFHLVGSNELRAQGLFQGSGGPERMTNSLLATYEWLDSRTKVPPERMQFMTAQEQAGLRYVRRAAERALGAGRRPLIVDDRQNNRQAGPVADLLARVVGADQSIVPAPDLRERLDASLALANLQANLTPSYQADYAAYQIGNFLVALGTEANANRNSFAWGYESARLRPVLESFPRRAGGAANYVSTFVGATRPLMEYFDDQSRATDAVKRLADWMRDNTPPSRQVFKPAG